VSDLAEVVESAAHRAWPALEEEALDGWTLRWSDGFTKRANSVQTRADHGVPVQDRVDRCQRWYAERSRPCIFRMTPFADPALDTHLASLGYASIDPTDVLHLGVLPPNATATTTLSDAPQTEWLACVARFNGLAEPHPALARMVERIAPPSLLGLLSAGSPAVAVGCGLAVTEDSLVGLFDLVVDPARRRRGHGDELVRRMLSWGAALGARGAYLQVTRRNVAARALYERLGFRHLYTYSYRVRL
jgi:ribosomal protein S18 acetylase RimI-like enzyme